MKEFDKSLMDKDLSNATYDYMRTLVREMTLPEEFIYKYRERFYWLSLFQCQRCHFHLLTNACIVWARKLCRCYVVQRNYQRHF